MGKTCLLGRIIVGTFEKYGSTVGGDMYKKNIKLDQSYSLQIVFHDTSGNKRYQALLGVSIRNANLAIIAYDVNCQKSFDQIPDWRHKILEPNPNCKIVIVGTKIDLRENKTFNGISTKKGRALADLLNCNFCEVSSKTGSNIDEFLGILTKILMENDIGGGNGGSGVKMEALVSKGSHSLHSKKKSKSVLPLLPFISIVNTNGKVRVGSLQRG